MYAYQGFWGALGRRIIGGIDAVGDAKSDAAVDKDRETKRQQPSNVESFAQQGKRTINNNRILM